ncbi:MAG: hypothetical protein K9L62_12945 [Vallitaleaceae bacterium]|nr:hypothetical protein [Vallitaleaceae bacterium]
MKKIIRVFSLLIMFTLTIGTVSAETQTRYTEKAQQLNDLGLFAGTENGFELDRAPKRVESAVMLVRLLGVEAEVKAGTFSHPFADVPTWADNYIGYMYEKGLTKGISATEFGSNQLTDARGYLTFVLRSLGYDDSNGDFAWSTSVDTAVENGLLTTEEKLRLESDQFLRDDMVNLSANALEVRLKGSEEKLFDSLVASGAIVIEKIETETNDAEIDNTLDIQRDYDFFLGMITNAIEITEGYAYIVEETAWGTSHVFFDTSEQIKTMDVKYMSLTGFPNPSIEELASYFVRAEENGWPLGRQGYSLIAGIQNGGNEDNQVATFFDKDKNLIAYAFLSNEVDDNRIKELYVEGVVSVEEQEAYEEGSIQTFEENGYYATYIVRIIKDGKVLYKSDSGFYIENNEQIDGGYDNNSNMLSDGRLNVEVYLGKIFIPNNTYEVSITSNYDLSVKIK